MVYVLALVGVVHNLVGGAYCLRKDLAVTVQLVGCEREQSLKKLFLLLRFPL